MGVRGVEREVRTGGPGGEGTCERGQAGGRRGGERGGDFGRSKPSLSAQPVGPQVQ